MGCWHIGLQVDTDMQRWELCTSQDMYRQIKQIVEYQYPSPKQMADDLINLGWNYLEVPVLRFGKISAYGMPRVLKPHKFMWFVIMMLNQYLDVNKASQKV